MIKLLLICLATTCLSPGSLYAETPPFPVVPATDSTGTSDHYCGLYCIYQAGKLTGQPVDLDRLIRPEYLRGEYGSTPGDLMACCDDFGIRSTFVPNLTYADACLLDGPLIVLIKNSPESPKANHWVMILRADLDSAELYYPSVGVIRVPAAELQSLWGGPAVIVLRGDEGTETQVTWVATKIAMLAGLLGFTYLALRLVGRTKLPPWAGLLLILAGSATLAHALNPGGFAHNGRTLRQMERLREPRTPQEVQPSELLGSREPVLIVDTRTPAQFQDARIPGAINIPISASHWRNGQILAAIPRGTRIVVYCNSESCPWAAALAKSSLLQEFPSVAILSDGVQGYTAAGGVLERGRPLAKGAE